MATIREIAKRVGFSQATVSRVLKDDPTFSVKDSTREKILNASLEMGYKNVPQYQRITIPQDVAILDNVVPDKGLQDAYFDELREVLVKHAEEQRMNVTRHEDVDSLIADADKYAGFISIGPSPLDHKTLHRLHKKLPHGVFIDINPAPTLFDSVQPDLEQTILDAIDALMGSGCSRIGFIGGLGNIMGKHEYPEDIRTFAFRNWALRLGLDAQGLVYADGPFTVKRPFAGASVGAGSCGRSARRGDRRSRSVGGWRAAGICHRKCDGAARYQSNQHQQSGDRKIHVSRIVVVRH